MKLDSTCFCFILFCKCVCTLTGLLAGFWEFPGLLQEGKNSDVKEKKVLCADINRILGTDLPDSLLQYVGEVRLMSATYVIHTCAHKFFL